MMFFGLIVAVTLLAALLDRIGIGGVADWRARMRWGLAAGLIFAGVDHLVTPGRYLVMMPEAVPFPREVVLFTGLCEIAGAIGLLVPPTRRLAGIMLAIYFVCVFPANIRNAIHGVVVDGLPAAPWYYWIRLAFQPLVILWALHAAAVIDLFRRRSAPRAALQ